MAPRRVMDCRTGHIRFECPDRLWGTAFPMWKRGRIAEEPFPAGHCMFDAPESYGCVAIDPQGTPQIRPEARAMISGAMRGYARSRAAWIGGRSYTEADRDYSDAAWNARRVARFMVERGIRFPLPHRCGSYSIDDPRGKGCPECERIHAARWIEADKRRIDSEIRASIARGEEIITCG